VFQSDVPIACTHTDAHRHTQQNMRNDFIALIKFYDTTRSLQKASASPTTQSYGLKTQTGIFLLQEPVPCSGAAARLCIFKTAGLSRSFTERRRRLVVRVQTQKAHVELRSMATERLQVSLSETVSSMHVVALVPVKTDTPAGHDTVVGHWQRTQRRSQSIL